MTWINDWGSISSIPNANTDIISAIATDLVTTRNDIYNTLVKSLNLGTGGLASGTTGNRPAAGTIGRTYFNTTTGVLEIDNGTTWTPLNYMVPSQSQGVFMAHQSIIFQLNNATNWLYTGNIIVNGFVQVTAWYPTDTITLSYSNSSSGPWTTVTTTTIGIAQSNGQFSIGGTVTGLGPAYWYWKISAANGGTVFTNVQASNHQLFGYFMGTST